MKTRFCVLLLSIIISSSYALGQSNLSANFIVQPYPSPYLSDWEINPTISTLTIYNSGNQPVEFRISLEVIWLEEGIIAIDGESEVNEIQPSPPSVVYNNTSMINWKDIDYDESLNERVTRTGRLPMGRYSACVRLVDPGGNVLLGPICANFTILYPDPPYLVYPPDESSVDSKYPLFQWTPIQIPPAYSIHYVFRLVEVLEGQTPLQALEANYPQYENLSNLVPYLQYPVSALPLELEKTYAWQVRVLDQYDEPPAANDGKSEIWTFRFGVGLIFEEVEGEPPGGEGNRLLSGQLRDFNTDLPVGAAKIVYHEVNRVINDDPFGPPLILYVEKEDSLITYSDDGGQFSFRNVRDSTYFSLHAHKSGYNSAFEVGPRFYQRGDIENLVFLITPATASVEGQVIDSVSRQPVAGATVELWRSYMDFVGGGGGFIDFGGGLMPVFRLVGSERTDEEGDFEFGDIPPNEGYYLMIDEPRYFSKTTESFSLSGGDRIDKGRIRLGPKLCSITGTVVDDNTGETIAGAQAYLFPDIAPIVGGGGFAEPDLPDVDWFPDIGWPAPGGPGGGTLEPPSMPDEPPLAGPVSTDTDGNFRFDDVLINNPAILAERYMIWVRYAGYYDSWEAVRIVEPGGTAHLDFSLSVAQGIIHGIVTSLRDGSPVSNARVELQNIVFERIPGGFLDFGFGGGLDISYETVQTVFTNPDGSYTISDIENGSYGRIAITKEGFRHFASPGPIEISSGSIIEMNAALSPSTGAISGIVQDDSGQPMWGVMVHVTEDPSKSAVSEADGSFIISEAPADSQELSFCFPEYPDHLDTVVVIEDDTVSITTRMSAYKGEIIIVVRDSVDNSFIEGASVRLEGKPPQETDAVGEASFSDVPIGEKTVNVTPPTDEDYPIDYMARSTTVEIRDGPNPTLTVKLARGARVSGTVVQADSRIPIPGAAVRIQGHSGLLDSTNAEGHFTLRNMPAEESIRLTASAFGYKNGRSDEFTLDVGEYRPDIDIALEESPMDSLYGFAVEVDSVWDISDELKMVRGAIINVPDNPVMEIQQNDEGREFKFYFNELEVDRSFNPTSPILDLAVAEAPVKVFGMKGKLVGAEEAFLQASWDDEEEIGQIKGAISFDDLIPTWIPGSEWVTENIAGAVAPRFYSDGLYRGGDEFGITVEDSEARLRFWGFELGVDYARTTLNETGFHYYGSIRFPGLDARFNFEDLNIAVSDEEGVEFNSVTIGTDPPVEIPLGVFTIVDSSATWNRSGFRASGAIVLTALDDREFGFRDLRLSTEGEILSVTVTADESSGTIEVIGQEFRIESLEFGTAPGDTHFFAFSGNMEISVLDEPIEFQNLKYTDAGDFTGTIVFNQSKTFADIVTIQLQSLTFEEESGVKYIYLRAGVAFDIPALGIKIGNFKFYEDGSYAVERIGIGFTAGPVQVAIDANWADDRFEGSGSLNIRPAFTAAAQFSYAGSDDWHIRVTAGANIPIGPFTIVEVTGGLGRERSTWIFEFGGGITVGRAERAIRGDVLVEVRATPDGPIIDGTMDVVVLDGTEIGHAEIIIDYPNERFSGSINFEWEKSGIELSAWVNIEINNGGPDDSHFWFVGAGARVDILDIARLDAMVFVARNYSGWMHALPVTYHPDNQRINGFHMDVEFHIDEDGGVYELNLDAWAYFRVDWNGDLSGGIKLNGSGYFDLWIIGGGAEVAIEAAVESVSNCIRFHGNVGFRLKLYTWPCDRNTGCWSYCFPTGGTACFSLDITADYACHEGWDFDVDW